MHALLHGSLLLLLLLQSHQRCKWAGSLAAISPQATASGCSASGDPTEQRSTAAADMGYGNMGYGIWDAVGYGIWDMGYGMRWDMGCGGIWDMGYGMRWDMGYGIWDEI